MKLNDGIMAANLSSMNPERVKLKALRSGYHDYIQLQTLQQDLQDIFVCPTACIEPIVTSSVHMRFFQTFSTSYTPPFLLTTLTPLTSQCFKYFKWN